MILFGYMKVPQKFVIQTSTAKHLDYFQTFMIINNSTMNDFVIKKNAMCIHEGCLLLNS